MQNMARPTRWSCGLIFDGTMCHCQGQSRVAPADSLCEIFITTRGQVPQVSIVNKRQMHLKHVCDAQEIFNAHLFPASSQNFLESQPVSSSSSLTWEKYCLETGRLLISASPPQLSCNSATPISLGVDHCDATLHQPLLKPSKTDSRWTCQALFHPPPTSLCSRPQLSSSCTSISAPPPYHATSLRQLPSFPREVIHSLSPEKQQLFHLRIACNSHFTVQHCALSLSLMFTN